jgi:hypothetical protein
MTDAARCRVGVSESRCVAFAVMDRDAQPTLERAGLRPGSSGRVVRVPIHSCPRLWSCLASGSQRSFDCASLPTCRGQHRSRAATIRRWPRRSRPSAPSLRQPPTPPATPQSGHNPTQPFSPRFLLRAEQDRSPPAFRPPPQVAPPSRSKLASISRSVPWGGEPLTVASCLASAKIMATKPRKNATRVPRPPGKNATPVPRICCKKRNPRPTLLAAAGCVHRPPRPAGAPAESPAAGGRQVPRIR